MSPIIEPFHHGAQDNSKMSHPRHSTLSSSSGQYPTPNSDSNSTSYPNNTLRQCSSPELPMNNGLSYPQEPYSSPTPPMLVHPPPVTRQDLLMRDVWRRNREKRRAPHRDSGTTDLAQYNPMSSSRLEAASTSTGLQYPESHTSSTDQPIPDLQFSHAPLQHKNTFVENAKFTFRAGSTHDNALPAWTQSPTNGGGQNVDTAVQVEDDEEDGAWIIPPSLIQYGGNVSDREAFRYARYSRVRVYPWDENDNAVMTRTKGQALDIFNAFLQVDDVNDGPARGGDAHAVSDMKNGKWDHDTLWKASWKVVMDCYEVHFGGRVGITIFKPHKPTPRDPRAKIPKESISKDEYDSFQDRFADVHSLHWFSKAYCKQWLDEEFSSHQLQGVSAPKSIVEGNKSQYKNNQRRPSPYKKAKTDQPNSKKAKTGQQKTRTSRSTRVPRDRFAGPQNASISRGRDEESAEPQEEEEEEEEAEVPVATPAASNSGKSILDFYYGRGVWKRK